jgi:hypothetical protein
LKIFGKFGQVIPVFDLFCLFSVFLELEQNKSDVTKIKNSKWRLKFSIYLYTLNKKTIIHGENFSPKNLNDRKIQDGEESVFFFFIYTLTEFVYKFQQNKFLQKPKWRKNYHAKKIRIFLTAE